ncbi:hypothetical protein V8G61_09155 [Gaetbulibacter sp. M240]|uniref:hypothetical protein n=1 Tax=Gaetbulibacter sp. M240 TaxID=3126511 RepID=UPI00374F062C
MSFKKTLKIIGGIVIFLTLPSLLLFGFLYFKYDEELPQGISGEQADILAENMLTALDYKAFEDTVIIEWTFKNRRHYKWNKEKNTCAVEWQDYKVVLDLKDHDKSKAFVHGFTLDSDLAKEYIAKALKYYNNDSFWLVAPYKVFDPGTKRQKIDLTSDKTGLLVTYTSGGTTPGDSYLWILDKDFKPTAFKMWVSIIPIDGLEASWSDWTTTQTGAQLPTFHKFLIFGIENTDIKTSD